MSQRIITGYVDSPSGRDALALADVLLALDPTSDLTVTRVYAYNPPEEPPVPTGWRKALRDRADAELDKIRGRYEGRPNVTVKPSCGLSASDGLHRLATATEATVTVVGTSHAHGVERLRSGSVTEHTIHGSPCAVAVAPTGFADAPAAPQTIAIAYNGSGESEYALATAAEIARTAGAKLRIIGVVEPGAVWYGAYGGQQLANGLDEVVREQLTQAAKRITDLPVEIQVLTGEPVHAISAATADVGLLVLGSRGYGPVRRVLLGSVSVKLVRAPSCPLLVLPRTAMPADALTAEDSD